MKKFSLSAFWLKVFAITVMLIDHIGAILLSPAVKAGIKTQNISPTFLNSYFWMRNIGRMAFPLFAFLLVQGFLHTSNYKRYLTRMSIFAVVSILPFNLAFGGKLYNLKYWRNFTFGNVGWTLLLGLILLYILDHITKKDWKIYLRWSAYAIAIAIFMGVAYWIHCDRRQWGILVIAGFYLFRDSLLKQVLATFVTFQDQRGLVPGPFWALIPIVLYNGKKGKDIKYFTYLFYPLHLLILYGIKIYLHI